MRPQRGQQAHFSSYARVLLPTPHCNFALPVHQHGKSKVRLGRTWREGDVHHFVEWNVATMLESPMEHAFIKVCAIHRALHVFC